MDIGEMFATRGSVAVEIGPSNSFSSEWSENTPNRSATTLDAALRRGMDVILASLTILFLSPLLVVLALAIFTADGGPILFGHDRIGRHGRIIKCWKFRSMVVDSQTRLESLLQSDPEALREWVQFHKLRVDPRVTPFGAFLRRSSLDELPQLLNVLAGEMSLVGPRPIVIAEKIKYRSRFDTYCSVRPGITGLWQISGRNDTSYRRRVAMDCAYVKKQTLLFDLKILAATLPAVFFSKGAY